MANVTWIFPADLLSASVEAMRPHGAVGNEGLALWFGTASGTSVAVTHVVAVHGPGFRSAPLQLRLSLNAMGALTDLGDQIGAYLVGQIHSHPRQMLDLSDVDRAYGIRCQDYLSLVCPHYAQRYVAGPDECGVHVFDDGHYRRIPASEVARRIHTSASPVKRLSVEVPA